MRLLLFNGLCRVREQSKWSRAFTCFYFFSLSFDCIGRVVRPIATLHLPSLPIAYPLVGHLGSGGASCHLEAELRLPPSRSREYTLPLFITFFFLTSLLFHSFIKFFVPTRNKKMCVCRYNNQREAFLFLNNIFVFLFLPSEYSETSRQWLFTP